MKKNEKIEQKFKDLYRALDNNNADYVMVHHPEVLGDDYEEIIYNLNKIAESGKSLNIVPPSERG
jgi:UDP-N-acetylglucosamine 2-epimerase